MTKYIIVGMQRSGTTVLHEALSMHPDVSCVVAEIDPIALFKQAGDVFAWGNDTSTNLRPAWGATKVFEIMTSAPEGNAASHFGLKLAVATPRAVASLKILNGPDFDGIKIIRIVRRNSLAQLSSLVLARSRNVWSDPVSAEKIAKSTSKRLTKVRISKGEFLQYILTKVEIEKQLDAITASLNTLKLVYEDDFEGDVSRALARSQEFLGVRKMPLKLRHKKQALPLSDTVSNYTEISQFASEIDDLLQIQGGLEQVRRRYRGLIWRYSVCRKVGNLSKRIRREFRPSL